MTTSAVSRLHSRAATLAATAFIGAAAGLALTPAQASVDVGVSVQISQPGVYGRVDIGRFPQPQVVVAQPVLVMPGRQQVQPLQPVYMWVPPGHRKNWSKHCGRYNACGVPVYFVQDNWYDKNVKPGKGQHAHGAHNGPGRQNARGNQGNQGNQGNNQGGGRGN